MGCQLGAVDQLSINCGLSCLLPITAKTVLPAVPVPDIEKVTSTGLPNRVFISKPPAKNSSDHHAGTHHLYPEAGRLD